MARWEPDAYQRLERAALALFMEHGFEATTADQIAKFAGLTKSTFFRHFADKREVLFGGQDMLGNLLRDAIRATPHSATVTDCLAAALESISVAFPPDRHELAARRLAIMAANIQLRERELLKEARLASAVADALRERGVDDTTARLAAQICLLALSTAYANWAASDNRRPFSEIALMALRDLQASATTLGISTGVVG